MWIVDSTPGECGRSRETVKRSDLAGWAEYGYCASHSRFFWGLRLHLVCTLQGLPVTFALTRAKADERETLLHVLAAEPALLASRPGQTLIGDKNYFGRDVEHQLAEQASGCCGRPARASRNGPAPRCSSRCGRSSSQSTRPSRDSSISNSTEHARPAVSSPASCSGILALTAAIWPNAHTGQPVLRSLTAYDH